MAHEIGHIFGMDDDPAGQPVNLMTQTVSNIKGVPMSDYSRVLPKIARSIYCSHNAYLFGARPLECGDVFPDPWIGAY